MLSRRFIENQRKKLEDKLLRYNSLNATNHDPNWIKQKRTVAIPFIKAALIAIDRGVYGICEDCGKKINKKRLMTVPAAIRCATCQKEAETIYP